MNGDSLLNTEQNSVQDDSTVKPQINPNKLPKKMMLLLIGIVVLSAVVSVVAMTTNPHSDTKIRIALPDQSPFPIPLGESRVFEVFFFSGHDNRIGNDYQAVTLREVVWSVSPKEVASVDAYGRLTTLTAGTATVRVELKSNTKSYAERTIKVVENTPEIDPQPRRMINYEKQPAKLNAVPQKIITFLTKVEALASDAVPETIKTVLRQPQTADKKTEVVQQGGATWNIVQYADKSGRSYLTRKNENQDDVRDRVMYLIGNRYLPDDGLSILSIEDDGNNGVWTANQNGASHIEIHAISYRQKAYQMTQNTKKYVMRHGLASDSHFDNDQWVPSISDNDGLWTSMFAAGQFMRYSSLKTNQFPDADIEAARANSLKSLKAVLLAANIPLRNTTIDAKLRHYVNTRAGSGEKLSSKFLKKDKPWAVDTYSGSSADGEGFFGIDAGSTIDKAFYGGKFKYSFKPLNQDDWTDIKDSPAATSKRSLNGFWARTFVIASKDGIPSGGLFFRHSEEGAQTVISGADKLYDYTADQHPSLNLGAMQLPEVLKQFIADETGAYERADLIYKGDTSTDEVIGHLFIYKIAYDILDEKNAEEKMLKDLIRSTLVRFCIGLVNNDYTMVDATGQGTSWSKLSHTFLTSDFTLQDAPIKAIQLLLSFKLCYYFTGDARWKDQYEYLIHDSSFRYLDLIAALWKRWTYRAFNEDAYADYGIFRLNSSVSYSQIQITRHIIASIHFSDEEEAFLAFYLAFQLEDNKDYLEKYRQGLEGWWHSVSRSENPLWYYIYQLAYPDQQKKDHFGNLLTETASWQLSRHPIDTKKTAAFVEGARKDVIVEGKEHVSTLSMNPLKVIGKRVHQSDGKYFDREITHKTIQGYDPMNIYEFKVLPADERSLHKFNGATFQGVQSSSPHSMQAATLYTLPYWMGIYHKMLKLQ